MKVQFDFYTLFAGEILQRGGFTRSDKLTNLQRALNDLLDSARATQGFLQKLLPRLTLDANPNALKSEFGNTRAPFIRAFDKYKKEFGASVAFNDLQGHWEDIPRAIRRNKNVLENLSDGLITDEDIANAVAQARELLMQDFFDALASRRSVRPLGDLVSQVVDKM